MHQEELILHILPTSQLLNAIDNLCQEQSKSSSAPIACISIPPASKVDKTAPSSEKKKKNYIQRKKSLDKSTKQIKELLDVIQVLQIDKKASSIDKRSVAKYYAQQVEAACWSPHRHYSQDSYDKLMAMKTHELCQVIFKSNQSTMDPNKVSQLQRQLLSQNLQLLPNQPVFQTKNLQQENQKQMEVLKKFPHLAKVYPYSKSQTVPSENIEKISNDAIQISEDILTENQEVSSFPLYVPNDFESQNVEYLGNNELNSTSVDFQEPLILQPSNPEPFLDF